MIAYNGDKIEVHKLYIYIKNERTGSSTIRKLKKIGKCEYAKNIKVYLKNLITEYKNGTGTTDTVNVDDVICEISEAEFQERFYFPGSLLKSEVEEDVYF